MKANELQIGDWVMVRPFPDSEPVKSKITAINYNSYRGKDYTDWVDTDFWDELSLDQVEPIPLTPEIFKKNGFKEGTYNILDKGGYKTFPEYKYINREEVTDISKNLIKVSYSDVNGGVYDISFGIGSHIFDLKYVHELQHTLRLCGIEKTIEL